MNDERSLQRRALLVALVANGAFLVAEAAGGFLFRSLALLADAAHMLSDVAALAIARGHLPGTTNLVQADADNPLRLIRPAGLCGQPRVVLNNAFGFGGINAALVLSAL